MENLVELARNKYTGEFYVVATNETIYDYKTLGAGILRCDPDDSKHEKLKGIGLLSKGYNGVNTYEVGGGMTVKTIKSEKVCGDGYEREKTLRDYAIVFYQIPEDEVEKALSVENRLEQELPPDLF